jgi:site-specific DNA-methyltransferase (adenine-specific)
MSGWREEVIGNARLILCDCREVLPTLGPVDALVTDPPFSIPHKFGSGTSIGPHGKRTLNFDWDERISCEDVIDAIRASLRLANAAFVFAGLRQVSGIASAVYNAGMTDKPAAWVKKYSVPAAPGNWWPSAFEIAVYGYRTGAFFGDTDTKRSNVFISDNYRHGPPGKVDHPTQKPLDLMVRIVGSIVPPSGIALDPFMGSGTTGVSCLQLGRRFIGIEIDPVYFDIACRRIDVATQEGRLFDPPHEKLPPPDVFRGIDK